MVEVWKPYTIREAANKTQGTEAIAFYSQAMRSWLWKPVNQVSSNQVRKFSDIVGLSDEKDYCGHLQERTPTFLVHAFEAEAEGIITKHFQDSEGLS